MEKGIMEEDIMEKDINEVFIEKLDSNMSIDQFKDEGFQWHNLKDLPQMVFGFPWFNREKIYRRLPRNPKYEIPEMVDMLAYCTSGGQIRFYTDSRRVAIRVKLAGSANMVHMPATGQCGFDCYVDNGHGIKYRSTTKYNVKNSSYEFLFFEWECSVSRKVVINFPLYQGVTDVWIGLDDSTTVFQSCPFDSNKRAVFYGSSITQGGCASRPGMSYTNILSRIFDMECINLGFSGNGKGEPELAKLISDIGDLDLIVLDYEANAWKENLLRKTLWDFIGILRAKHTYVPILVVSKLPYADEVFEREKAGIRKSNIEFQKNLVNTLQEQGDRYIYFLDGSGLLGKDFNECMVDGVHPTDLGFYQIAGNMSAAIHEILSV